MPSDLPATEQDHAADVLLRISSTSSTLSNSIETEVEKQFGAVWQYFPSGLGVERASARQTWMLKNFYRIAGLMTKDVPVQRSNSSEPVRFIFEPVVPLTSLPAQAQDAARNVVARVTPELAGTLPAALKKRCREAYQALPPGLGVPYEKLRSCMGKRPLP